MQTIKIDRLDFRLLAFFHKERQSLAVFIQRLHDRDDLTIEIAVLLVGQPNLFGALFGLLLVEEGLAFNGDLFFQLIFT